MHFELSVLPQLDRMLERSVSPANRNFRPSRVTSGLPTNRALTTVAFPGTDAVFALLVRICDSELPRVLTGKGLAPEPRVSFDVHFLDTYELNRCPLT